jgi:hypothetical protein
MKSQLSGMDMATILAHLKLAEQHLRTSVVELEKQRSLVADTKSGGQGASLARAQLQQIEEVHKLLVADCDRLRAKLANQERLISANTNEGQPRES